MPKYDFHIGVTLRCYGNVKGIEAESIEAALPLLTADFIGQEIDITETTTDSGQDLAIIDISDPETGEDLGEEWHGRSLPSPYDPVLPATMPPGLSVNKVLAVPQFLLDEATIGVLLAGAKDCVATAAKNDAVLKPFIAAAETELTERGYPADYMANAANDTVDALVQAESFVAGFEGDELQEGVADMLAGLRAAIVRERERPDLLAALDGLINNGFTDEELARRWSWSIGAIQEARAAFKRSQADASAKNPRVEFIEMIARLSASGDKVDLDGEEWPNGYQHDTGDSLDALDELIHKARAMTGIQPPEPEADDGEAEGDTND